MVRRAKAKRKQKEAEEAAAKQRTVIISAIRIISYHYKIVINCISLRENNREYGLVFVFQTNKFTDEDIRGVVKSFKMNFPQGFHIKVSETGISDWENLEIQFSEGNMNKKATVELIRRIFPRFTMSLLFKQSWFHSPRFDADCVMKNIFEIFDSQNTGRVILIYNTFISNMATSRWPVTRYFGYFQWPWTALVICIPFKCNCSKRIVSQNWIATSLTKQFAPQVFDMFFVYDLIL